MIAIKSKNEIECMRQAGKVVARALDKIQEVIKPGTTTRYIDNLAEEFILQQNAVPALKTPYGFQATLCLGQ